MVTSVAEKFIPYAEDFILTAFGPEADILAKNFVDLNDHAKIRIENYIDSNLEYIKNKNIIDIGSNNGFWAVMLMLAGAKSVTCIEPRHQLVDRTNKFAKKHNFNIDAKIGTYDLVYQLEPVDTIVLYGNTVRLIPDFCNFAQKIKTETLIIDHIKTNHGTNIKPIVQRNVSNLDGYITGNLEKNQEIAARFSDIINNTNVGKYLEHEYSEKYFDLISNVLGCNKECIYYFKQNQEYFLYRFLFNYK